MKATYRFDNGRFANKSITLGDQWDYTGDKYEFQVWNVYQDSGSYRWRERVEPIRNAIEKLSGPSSKFSRPRKRVIPRDYGGDIEVVRYKSVITLKGGGIKAVSVNVDKATIPYITNTSFTRGFIASVIDLLMPDSKGDESNDNVTGGTLAYDFNVSDDPVKGRYLRYYNTISVSNSDLPTRYTHYPMYDSDNRLWFYAANKNGGGTVRLTPEQLLSSLKLVNPQLRFGLYLCQDLKQMHANFDNDNAYSVGNKRVGPSTHTDVFSAIGKAINDRYFGSGISDNYGSLISNIAWSMYDDDFNLRDTPNRFAQERIDMGRLSVGVIDRWNNKKAPITVYKAPTELCETDLKDEVIKQIISGKNNQDAQYTAKRIIRATKENQVIAMAESQPDSYTKLLDVVGLPLKFENKTF